MTIDLKWLLPFVLPFVVLGVCFALSLLAGLEMSDHRRSGIVVFSLFFGCGGGFVSACVMHSKGSDWPLHIGRKP